MKSVTVHCNGESYTLAKTEYNFELACVFCAIIPNSNKCDRFKKYSIDSECACGSEFYWKEQIAQEKHPKRKLKT